MSQKPSILDLTLPYFTYVTKGKPTFHLSSQLSFLQYFCHAIEVENKRDNKYEGLLKIHYKLLYTKLLLFQYRSYMQWGK